MDDVYEVNFVTHGLCKYGSELSEYGAWVQKGPQVIGDFCVFHGKQIPFSVECGTKVISYILKGTDWIEITQSEYADVIQACKDNSWVNYRKIFDKFMKKERLLS